MKSLLRVFSIFFIISGCSTTNPEKIQSIPSGKAIEKSVLIKSFDYKPEVPVNGELFATIEIGSSGLNYFIVDMDEQNRWLLKKSGFGESFLMEGNSNIDDIFLKIESYKRDIIEAGVSKDNIYVIASSSAIKLSDIQEIQARLSISGIKLRSISAEQEGVYDLIATVPKEFIQESFLVDIGSGNTKITWISNFDTASIETYGSKYYIDTIHDTTAFRTVRDLIIDIPPSNRNLCFLLGGIPHEFAAATSSREGRYTLLDQPGNYAPTTQKGKAGKIIYNAIYLEPTFSYIFDSESNFSIGYLMNLKSR